MNPMKAYEVAKSMPQEQLLAAMKGKLPEVPAYIAASVMQEQKKIRDSAQSQPPADTRTVMQELEEGAQPQPTGIAALPQMAQGGEEVPEGGIVGYAAGGQVSNGNPTPEIREQMKNDKSEKLMSDYAEYKANGGTLPLEEYARQPKGYAEGGMVDDDPVGDIDDLEREYAEYAAMQGFTAPEQASAAYTAAPSTGQKPSGIGTLADRNNNPGNIRDNGKTKWNGQVGSEKGFVKFESPEHGKAAMEKLLGNYQTKHGKDTVAGIIGRWAPSSENNTGSYISAIAKKLGVGPHDKINVQDPTTRRMLASAMATHEGWSQGYAVGGQVEEDMTGWSPEEIKSYNLRMTPAIRASRALDARYDNATTQAERMAVQAERAAAQAPSNVNGGYNTAAVWHPDVDGDTRGIYPQQDMDNPFSVQPLSEVAPAVTTPKAPAAPAPVKPAPAPAVQKAADTVATAGIPAAGAAVGAGFDYDKEYNTWKKRVSDEIPKLDPKYAARNEKEMARYERDRAREDATIFGMSNADLIRLGAKTLAGTNPNPLVNFGEGLGAMATDKTARQAQLDKRGDNLSQRDLLLAQAEQARAAGNVQLAMKYTMEAKKYDVFAQRAQNAGISSDRQMYYEWKKTNPNGTIEEFYQGINGAKNSAKEQAKADELFAKDKDWKLMNPKGTKLDWMKVNFPHLVPEAAAAGGKGYSLTEAGGKITAQQ